MSKNTDVPSTSDYAEHYDYLVLCLFKQRTVMVTIKNSNFECCRDIEKIVDEWQGHTDNIMHLLNVFVGIGRLGRAKEQVIGCCCCC